MSTRYGHSNVSGGNQDQGERKDEGWEPRQGGSQSSDPGRTGEPGSRDESEGRRESQPPPGTNTQGELAGIREASAATLQELPPRWREGEAAEEADGEASGRADESGQPAGTDQPPRMGGPLGPDPKHDPHLPEGAQSNEDKGTGAGGFDRGVDATNVGAVHQGARPEEPAD